MKDAQNGCAPRLCLCDKVKHHGTVARVQAGGWFIQLKRRIAMGKTARDIHPLLFTP